MEFLCRWDSVLQFLRNGDALRLPTLSSKLFGNHELALSLQQYEGFRLVHISRDLWSDEFCFHALESAKQSEFETFLSDVPSHIRNSRRGVIAVLRVQPSLAETLYSDWCSDRGVVLDIVSFVDGDSLRFFPMFNTDREIVLSAVRKNGDNLGSAPVFRADREIALVALETVESADVADELLSDITFIKEAVERNPYVLIYTAKWLDIELARESVKRFPYSLKWLSEDMQALVWEAAVENDPMSLQHVPPFRRTRTIVEKAVVKNPRVFAQLPEWWDDRPLMSVVLSREGMLLCHPRLNPIWCNDREMVQIAVSQNGLALEFASQSLKCDDKVLRAALRQNGLALAFADRSRRCCSEYVEIAVRQNHFAIAFSNCCYRVQKRMVQSRPPTPVTASVPWYYNESDIYHPCGII
jgi:hypothetical protein